jgi:hypothetical protein
MIIPLAAYAPITTALATFRRGFLDELSGLFVQVREMAKEVKLVKLGNVCLDGTKIAANASSHSVFARAQSEVCRARGLPDRRQWLLQREKIKVCEAAGIHPLIAVARDKHHPGWREPHSEPEPLPENATPAQAMSHLLESKAGRALYASCKQTVEPVSASSNRSWAFARSRCAVCRRSRGNGRWSAWLGI